MQAAHLAEAIHLRPATAAGLRRNMRELRALREGWEAVKAQETSLLRSMSTQDSVRQWLMLQQSFEFQLQQTAAIFGPERREALAQLQSRLRRMAEWQAQRG
jgi:hypothetical protein